MAFRAGLVLLVLALATVARSSTDHAVYYPMGIEPVGHALVDDAMDDEFMMESDSARRQLAGGGGGHVSYGALKRNAVPCNQRGKSYYNCRDHQKANPYQRGCTRASRCARSNR